VVPEAWGVYNPVLQVGSASTAVYQTDDLNIMSNAYYSGGWKFIATDTATRYQQAGGAHTWYTSASGNADAALTWVQALLLSDANLTIPNGNLVVANGHGIDFSATGDGGVTTVSELLDDYEEGTFTATLRGSGNEPNTLITQTVSFYTRVGNMCHVNLGFVNVNTTGYSGNITITGLPFNTNNSSSRGGFYVNLYNVTFPNGAAAGLITGGGNTIALISPKTNDAWGTVTFEGVANTYIEMSFSYRI